MAESTFSGKDRYGSVSNLSLGNFNKDPLVFVGISAFETSSFYNFRLKLTSSSISGSPTKYLKADFLTWSYTRVYVAEHKYLATCKDFSCMY